MLRLFEVSFLFHVSETFLYILLHIDMVVVLELMKTQM